MSSHYGLLARKLGITILNTPAPIRACAPPSWRGLPVEDDDRRQRVDLHDDVEEVVLQVGERQHPGQQDLRPDEAGGPGLIALPRRCFDFARRCRHMSRSVSRFLQPTRSIDRSVIVLLIHRDLPGVLPLTREDGKKKARRKAGSLLWRGALRAA